MGQEDLLEHIHHMQDALDACTDYIHYVAVTPLIFDALKQDPEFVRRSHEVIRALGRTRAAM